MVWQAEAFAKEKHFGQFDRAGVPYIEHPRAVAAQVETDTEKVVAFLHDTVEDTNTTLDEIRNKFGTEIADAVECLTHQKGVPYMEYIKGIQNNALARKVKLADLTHNMDLSRLPKVTEEDRRRVKKYKAAYDFLMES